MGNLFLKSGLYEIHVFMYTTDGRDCCEKLSEIEVSLSLDFGLQF